MFLFCFPEKKESQMELERVNFISNSIHFGFGRPREYSAL